jgi:predicted ArsR family transcriptional regulator
LYGPATSTGLAERLDTNTGATSYHLRRLEGVGLVTEDTDRGTGRERWWKSPHDGTSWVTSEFLNDPDDRAAADWLIGTYAQMNAQWHNDWLEARHQWSREWQDAAGDSSSELFLTADQLSALNRELHEVIDRYTEGVSAADAERVKVLLYSFPAPEPRL